MYCTYDRDQSPIPNVQHDPRIRGTRIHLQHHHWLDQWIPELLLRICNAFVPPFKPAVCGTLLQRWHLVAICESEGGIYEPFIIYIEPMLHVKVQYTFFSLLVKWQLAPRLASVWYRVSCHQLNVHHGWAGWWPDGDGVSNQNGQQVNESTKMFQKKGGKKKEREKKIQLYVQQLWSKQNKINRSRTFRRVYEDASILSTVSSLVFRFHPFMVATRLTNPTTWLLLYSCRV